MDKFIEKENYVALNLRIPAWIKARLVEMADGGDWNLSQHCRHALAVYVTPVRVDAKEKK